MKLYYIDDSMFHTSKFASQVMFRFEQYIRKNPCDVILISAAKEGIVNIEHLRDLAGNVNVLMSPALFDVEGVKGNLQHSFLLLDDFEVRHCYSGSFVAYDTVTKNCERIYLEMFINHDITFDYIVSEMEQLIKEKVMKAKKNSRYH